MVSAGQPPALDGGRHSLSDRACARCGYGIAAGRSPDRCPMCGGAVWRRRPHLLRNRWPRG